MPLLLLARGSRGQAPSCAPSLYTAGPISDEDNVDGRYVQHDLDAMVWPLVASGFAVAVTDSAGYANYGAAGNPPPACSCQGEGTVALSRDGTTLGRAMLWMDMRGAAAVQRLTGGWLPRVGG